LRKYAAETPVMEWAGRDPDWNDRDRRNARDDRRCPPWRDECGPRGRDQDDRDDARNRGRDDDRRMDQGRRGGNDDRDDG
jgi:hypothetical protein